MSRPLLAVAVPVGLAPVLCSALRPHPALVVRDHARLWGLRSALDEHTRARVHSDRMPWDHGADWVDRLVDAEVARFATHGRGRRAVWSADHPEHAAETAAILGAEVLRWIVDPRHAIVRDAADPIAAAADAGERWARRRATAAGLPAVDVDGDPASLLDRLGLARHPTTETALSMLWRLPIPALPPAVIGALGAHPVTAAALRDRGVVVPPPPETPEVLIVRAATAHADADRAGLAERALALQPDPAQMTRAIDLLVQAGETARARAHLVRWMRRDDATGAWERLLTDRTGPPEPRWLRRAQRHPEPRVRGALARWLVREGLDRQAAETVCRVRGVDWFRAPAPAG